MAEFKVRLLQPQLTASVRLRVAPEQLGEELGKGLAEVWEAIQAQGVVMGGPPFARYFVYEPQSLDLEAGCPVKSPAAAAGRVGPNRLPGGMAAVGLHLGPYHSLRQTYFELAEWMQARGYEPNDDPWESYLTDPDLVPNPADWETEVIWPVGRRI